MFSWLRRHRGTGIALLACFVVLVGSLVAPAFGAPSALSLAKKALKTSKNANKRSKKALRRANKALREAGKPGATGPRGPAGAPGRNGFGELVYGVDSAAAVANGGGGTSGDFVLAQCPRGTFPTGGAAGADNSSTGDPVSAGDVITQQGVAVDDTTTPFAWYAYYHNLSGTTADVFAEVACANANTFGFASASAKHAKRFHRSRR